MNISDALKLLDAKITDARFEDISLRGLSVDSRTVASDYAFVAVKGSNSDGHDHIKSALEKGARLIVYEDQGILNRINKPDECVFVRADNSRKALAKLACAYFGHPADKLVNIGITGTNGKTTVSYIIDHIFKTNNIKAGLIGTIQYRISDHIVKAVNTTPDAVRMQHLLHHMVDHDLSHCIMEVSSHALDQYRVQGIDFRAAVFTNLTHDHLDYHKDKKRYFLAKARLFEDLGPESWAVINSDDEYGRQLKNMTKARVLTYAVNDDRAMLIARGLKLGIEGTEFICAYDQKEYPVKTSLIGRHNVYNVLAAVAAAVCCGISIDKAIASLASVPAVNGRLEKIRSAKGFAAFIDYAHTEDALKNVLMTLQELKPRRIITVFGCGGDRDKQKRPLMGKTASRLSDFLILTNDNPRSEDPHMIIEQIASGFKQDFTDYEIIPDRKTAIEKACSMAGKGDFVLIAGKGHETTQVFKDKTIESDDRKIAASCLEK